MTAIVQNVVTSGVFELDGGSWAVDNNVWLVGDDTEVIVIDAAHDADRILDAVGDRKVLAIVSTHGHNDHVNAAPDLSKRTGAPILLHAEDRVVWDLTHPDRAPDGELTEGQTITVAGTDLRVLHTPGHAPGAVCLYAAKLGALFSGDTLFNGGPGATGRSYSDYPTIVDSITEKLFALPDETVVHTGHGERTTIGEEKAGSTGWDAP
ncbi:Zn-dependent hydrolase [Amycolatopsis antarctica]|uniref:Zn-dependent hydrolase n=1 Tax=Amycolatopsis antarctica TaxID=1854586 RepID=A0A263D8B5_9PSEU|nr:MBL fold metallo-hydrolase [Amycolatopsis antarctica]OZM73635.1 Zn-dependent hydrolase [Amycolatopsis antarctica]